MEIETRIELKRECGFRKAGKGGVGLYFVGGPLSKGCGRLPFPLHGCPACGGGVHQHRGAQWIEPNKFFGGEGGTMVGGLLGEVWALARDLPINTIPGDLVRRVSAALEPPHPCENRPENCERCPMAGGAMPERALLMWVGEKFYPTTQTFLAEAAEMGISKRLGALPRGWKPGDVVYLAHPKAVMPWHRGWVAPAGREVDGESLPLLQADPDYIPANDAMPGVFSAFVPALEVVVDTDNPEEAPEYAHRLAEQFGDAVKFVKVERAPGLAQAVMPGGEEHEQE